MANGKGEPTDRMMEEYLKKGNEKRMVKVVEGLPLFMANVT